MWKSLMLASQCSGLRRMMIDSLQPPTRRFLILGMLNLLNTILVDRKSGITCNYETREMAWVLRWVHLHCSISSTQLK